MTVKTTKYLASTLANPQLRDICAQRVYYSLPDQHWSASCHCGAMMPVSDRDEMRVRHAWFVHNAETGPKPGDVRRAIFDSTCGTCWKPIDRGDTIRRLQADGLFVWEHETCSRRTPVQA